MSVGVSNGCTTCPLCREPEFNFLPGQRCSVTLFVQMLLHSRTAAHRRKQERCCKNCPIGLSCLKWHSMKVSQYVTNIQTSLSFSPTHYKNWMCIGETVIYHGAWADADNFVVPSYFSAFSEDRNDTLLMAFMENRFLYYCPVGHGSRAQCLVALLWFLPFIYSEMHRNLPESWWKSQRYSEISGVLYNSSFEGLRAEAFT